MKHFLLFSGALVTKPTNLSFPPFQGCTFTLCHVGSFGISIKIILTSRDFKYSNIKFNIKYNISENSLMSDLVRVITVAAQYRDKFKIEHNKSTS